MPEYEAKKEIAEMIKKVIERDDSFIEGSLKNLALATDSCRTEAAEIAVRTRYLIDHQRSISEIFLSLGDQPEKAHEDVLVKTNQQEQKLNYILKDFVKTCSCMHNT